MSDKLKMGETHTEFVCDECEDQPHFLREELAKHVKEVHGIDPKTKGKRKMLMHLDSTEYARSTYEWNIAGLKLREFAIYRRAADDMMRFA